MRADIAQSVQRLATGWTVRGSNPGGGEIFHTRPDRPWGPPSLLYVQRVPGLFPGVKRPGLCFDHPPPSRAQVKERVDPYLYSPSGSSWPVQDDLYLYPTTSKFYAQEGLSTHKYLGVTVQHLGARDLPIPAQRELSPNSSTLKTAAVYSFRGGGGGGGGGGELSCVFVQQT